MNELLGTTRWGKRLVIIVASCILFLTGPVGGKIGPWSFPGIATVEAASYCLGQPDGTLCDDGKPCTVNDVCAAGVCAGVPKNCDDGNACTKDTCNATTGACVHTNVRDNTLCEDNDGNPCTGVCSAGVCTTGVRPKSYCLDKTACTIDTCDAANPNADPATGCVHTPTPVCYTTTANNFTMLNPGGGMTGGTNDVVFTWDGTCNDSVATAVVNATISSNEGFSGPTWAANNVMIYCPGGPYVIHPDAVAGDPSCALGMDAGYITGFGVTNIPSGTPCIGPTYTFTVGDGQLAGHMLFAWNGNANIDVVDIWSQGTFSGTLFTGADNGDSCSAQPCDGARNSAAKVWDFASTDWDGDGLPGAQMLDGPFAGFNANFNLMKIVTDKCAGIDCSLSALRSQCQSDACDPATGRCVYTAINEGAACNDNNACTTGDVCVSGACTGTPVNCDDNNACTSDYCNKTTGICSHSTPKYCNDSNSCTADSCDPATGNCVFTPLVDGTACTPPPGMDVCTVGTTCISGVCGTPKDCSDGDPCTVDACAMYTGCTHTPVACTNNPACITASCDAATGSCVFAPKDCTDNNVCTTDSCVPATGACINTAIDIDDHNACTADSCDPLTGVAHTPIICDDGNLCTTDSCDPATGCVFTAISCDDNLSCTTDTCTITGCVNTITSGCLINNACIAEGAVNPANQCQACISAISKTAWSNKPANTTCNDGKYCTVTDTCNGSGACVGSGNPCPTGGTCTETGTGYTCGVTVCTASHVGQSCNDNNACTQNDKCVAKVTGKKTTYSCQGTAVNCNDNNACTKDSCDPATGACVNTTITCNDGNICTIDSCNPKIGCVYKSKCDDGNICTTDRCNTQTGECTYAPKPKKVTMVGSLNNGETTTQNLEVQATFEVTNGGCIMYTSGTSMVKVSPGSKVTVSCAGTTPQWPVNYATLDHNVVTIPTSYTCPDLDTTHNIYVTNAGKSGKGPGHDTDNYQIRASTNGNSW